MADPVGTPLAALATAEQCIRFAKLLRQKYKDYKSAEQHISELVLALESYSTRIEIQVTFLQRVWQGLEQNHQNILNTHLHLLSHKLNYGIELVEAATSSSGSSGLSRTDKLRFAFSLKDCLRKAVDELKSWHDIFDPLWYLISRVDNVVVEQSLKRYDTSDDIGSVSVLKNLRRATRQLDGKGALRLDLTAIAPSTVRTISGSSIKVGELSTGEPVIISTFTQDSQVMADVVDRDVDKLVLTLANVDPYTFGLLQCHGSIKREEYDSTSNMMRPLPHNLSPWPRLSYDLLFRIPEGFSKPITLRTYLKSSAVALDIRLSLAQSLSNAVMYVHSSKFVHKNIRPETILNFFAPTTLNRTGSNIVPYLTGFEKFRLADGQTFRAGDSNGEENLYRHPKRQGLWPEDEYKMLHDIYSLGVVLLEIGIWTSFVVDEPSKRARSQDNWSAGVVPASDLSITEPSMKSDSRVRAVAIKDLLVQLAKKRLPSCMGTKYSEVVVSCLTCCDSEDPGLGDLGLFYDKDDVNIGVEFVESVIVRLQEISM